MIILYSNGIIEEILPKDKVFTNEELSDSFKEFKSLSSIRLIDIPNTWCLWGVMETPPDNEYNRVGSEIVEHDISSHLLIIHDSEINPSWDISDHILYKPYNEFAIDVNQFIVEIVKDIVDSNIEELKQNPDKIIGMLFLTAIGQTNDKRVLFEYDPFKQNDDFYANSSFDMFQSKTFAYLKENFWNDLIREIRPLTVFSDNKTIIIINDNNIKKYFSELLNYYSKKEQYENCEEINKIKIAWISYLESNETTDASIGEAVTKNYKNK